jgi:hypothetical protein
MDKIDMEISLNTDQVRFLETLQEQYKIKDSGKVIRILLDYALTNSSQQDEIFSEKRCLRCG